MTQTAERPHRLILCNDGGTLQGVTAEAPIGAQGLADATIGPLVDTHVDTLYWQLGTDPGIATPSHRLSDVYSHDTEVGPRFGADGAAFDSAGSWRMYENRRSLLAAGTDPAAVVIEHGHRADLEVFLSLRINDIHDGSLSGPEHALFSSRKREHPEWLLGPVRKPAVGTRIEGLSRFAYDFGIPAVRDYKLELATEAIEKCELDGLDLDFCRFPRLFAEGEEARGAKRLTDFLSRVRTVLDNKSRRTGRRLLLSCGFSLRLPWHAPSHRLRVLARPGAAGHSHRRGGPHQHAPGSGRGVCPGVSRHPGASDRPEPRHVLVRQAAFGARALS